MALIRRFQFGLSAVLVAVLAACGGGDDTPVVTKVPVTSLRVMGDSLADVGTFGIKFTIQGNDTYPERVSTAYSLGKGCNFFTFTGTTFATNTAATGCTNYAVGGGVINPAGSALTATDPRGLAVQFAAATAAGNYAAGDLLLVDGGGNDAAALVGAYLNASTDGGAAYLGVLGTVLTAGQVSAAAAGGATGLAAAGSTYMTALADNFYTLVKTSALDKGAKRIVLLNMPGVTNTPRFQTVLDSIAAAYGGGTTGATARAQSEGLFKSWTVAFNTQLAAKFAGNSQVVVVDFYTAFNNQIASPATYGLTNVTTPACPITGVGTDGLPSYTFATCTDATLAAALPAGVTSTNWYKTYAFSDGFHPTPLGHQLLAAEITKALTTAGWL
ncbi:SGNH/GDSL hydrolase family protein [Sphaerotilus sp.]|uniref:SGNH/GDSL hydrolase family protein n=1 Tax=Sphaerotilus sp. TaxID=2093942 RepID=UPI00286DC3B2|nr:SGNH/GDSL hydrolase family protein [Sphaerotilus sp.]